MYPTDYCKLIRIAAILIAAILINNSCLSQNIYLTLNRSYKFSFSPYSSNTIVYNGYVNSTFNSSKFSPVIGYKFNKNLICIDMSFFKTGISSKIRTDYYSKEKNNFTSIGISKVKEPLIFSLKYGRVIANLKGNDLLFFLGINNYILVRDQKISPYFYSEQKMLNPSSIDSIKIKQEIIFYKQKQFIVSPNISVQYNIDIFKHAFVDIGIELNKGFMPIYITQTKLEVNNTKYVFFNNLNDTYISFYIGIGFNKGISSKSN